MGTSEATEAPTRSSLQQIEFRRTRDRWRDVVFIAGALLLTALSIGAVTSQAVGKASSNWSVRVIESAPEIVR